MSTVSMMEKKSLPFKHDSKLDRDKILISEGSETGTMGFVVMSDVILS